MTEFIITFRNGDPIRKNCFAVIEAPDQAAAHALTFEQYGHNWAFCYPTRAAAGVAEYGLTEIPWGE